MLFTKAILEGRPIDVFDGGRMRRDFTYVDDVAEGVLRVVGRTADFIIRGGKNISAAQVEDEVSTHPAVALCAVVPMPDAVLGERVCACVELRPAQTLKLDELCAHLASRGVGKELWPERLEVFDALPRSSGGKIAKGDLRDQMSRSSITPPSSRPSAAEPPARWFRDAGTS